MNNDIFSEAKYKIGQRVLFEDYLIKNGLTYRAEYHGLIVGVALENALTGDRYVYSISIGRCIKKLDIQEKWILSLIE